LSCNHWRTHSTHFHGSDFSIYIRVNVWRMETIAKCFSEESLDVVVEDLWSTLNAGLSAILRNLLIIEVHFNASRYFFWPVDCFTIQQIDQRWTWGSNFRGVDCKTVGGKRKSTSSSSNLQRKLQSILIIEWSKRKSLLKSNLIRCRKYLKHQSRAIETLCLRGKVFDFDEDEMEKVCRTPASSKKILHGLLPFRWNPFELSFDFSFPRRSRLSVVYRLEVIGMDV
jgi:hypothetical protein